MITLLAILIAVGSPVLLWVVAARFDSRYREGGVRINTKRVGR